MKNIGFAVLVVSLSVVVFTGIRAYQNKRAADRMEREAEAEAKAMPARRQQAQQAEDCVRAQRNLVVLRQAAAKGSEVTLLDGNDVAGTRAARDVPYLIGDTERYIARNCGRR